MAKETFLATAGSTSGLSAPICTCTGLPVGGPARGAVTSTSDPRGSVLPAKRHDPMPAAPAGRSHR